MDKALSILGIKLGHDGSMAHLSDQVMNFSYENEKDNGLRYSEIEIDLILKTFKYLSKIPDVIAISGWDQSENQNYQERFKNAGYFGLDNIINYQEHFLGKNTIFFSSSHERSHILCAYGLSPYPQGQPCFVLVWEGLIGSIYYIDEHLNIKKLKEILPFPGIRYSFLFGLADPTFKFKNGAIRLSDAGKLMALVSFAKGDVQEEDKEVISKILSNNIKITDLSKDNFSDSFLLNCGLDHPRFHNAAKYFSDQLFDIFYQALKPYVNSKVPLLISGGCGLNCDWNTKWVESDLFSDVFIPPCSNDSGSAIGTAIDALYFYTGKAKVDWNVFSGETPFNDMKNGCAGFKEFSFSSELVAQTLAAGKVIGWIKGKYEIGPRALGARSILAAPMEGMLNRLNKIKKRENFRPIAPICLEEDMSTYFNSSRKSPYMLEFRTVKSDKIPAVTHVDKSARPQSVNESNNPEIYKLILEFKKLTGLSVLCNTSLNFNGYGFINTLSDLYRYCFENGLDGFVFENKFFLREENA